MLKCMYINIVLINLFESDTDFVHEFADYQSKQDRRPGWRRSANNIKS